MSKSILFPCLLLLLGFLCGCERDSSNPSTSPASPNNLTETQWENTTNGASTVLLNNPSNNTKYGKLYNWYAVVDPRELCPTGWHIPTDNEWSTLEDFLGGNAIAGGKMKTTGFSGSGGLWNSPNTGATNSSGFSGLPAGYCFFDGAYGFEGIFCGWWSSDEIDPEFAWCRSLYYSDTECSKGDDYKNAGYSVRCIRN